MAKDILEKLRDGYRATIGEELVKFLRRDVDDLLFEFDQEEKRKKGVLVGLLANFEFWWKEWEAHKDMAAFRNATFAAGRVRGAAEILDIKLEEEMNLRFEALSNVSKRLVDY